MNTLWDDAARRELLARIDRIESSSKPKWGRMTAERMLAHLAESLKMATGELHCKSKRLPIRFFPLKQLILYVFPFPKGSPTAPELLAGAEAPVGAIRAEIHRLAEKFVSQRDQAAWPEHPAFGKLDAKGWGHLSYKHLAHHLEQFGV